MVNRQVEGIGVAQVGQKFLGIERQRLCAVVAPVATCNAGKQDVAVGTVFLLKLEEVRIFRGAWSAPITPEMKHNHFSFHGLLADGLVRIDEWLNIEFGDRLADNPSFFSADEQQNANASHHEKAG